MLERVFPFYEVAITGSDWQIKTKELDQYYIPNKLVLGGANGTLPLLEGKMSTETKIYVCVNRTCQLPVTEVIEAVGQMKEDFPLV
ncbi:hypothetical protein D3C75_1309390 [compost metagenome]